MDEVFQRFLRQSGPVLCLDIGSVTQDVVLARSGVDTENWPRFCSALAVPDHRPAYPGADTPEKGRVAVRGRDGRQFRSGCGILPEVRAEYLRHQGGR